MLTGEDIDRLSRLLRDTLNENDLESIVHAATGDRLYDEFVGRGQPLRPTIHNLLVELEKSGLTTPVLAMIYQRRPNRPDIRDAIARLVPDAARAPVEDGADLSLQRAGVPEAIASEGARAPGLQRNVRPNLTKLDIQVWSQRLIQIERQVCRIEHDGNPVGTGFLVGPEVVLTNWHVVEAASKAGTLGHLAGRFDYVRLADTSRQPGVVVPMHGDGCLDSRPYAPAEITATPESPAPAADELDYALLRLTVPVGIERGWITLPAAPAAAGAGAPLLIVQHPDGGPMKLAMDTEAVIGLTPGGLRLRYKTNTDPGSSGSPCFTMDWDLIALHHFGDPAWRAPAFNQGVPANLIRHSIAARGHGAWLGERTA